MVPRSLSRKVLAIILAASTLITTALTAITFYIDYRSELGLLDRSFGQLERLTLGPLSTAVWSFDDEQISKFLEGIVATGDFVEADLFDMDGTELYTFHRPEQNQTPTFPLHFFIDKPSVDKTFKLFLNQGTAQVREVGTLRVKASRLAILQRLMRKLILTFALQAVKTLIISLVILAIVQNLLTKHIMHVARYLENLRVNSLKSTQALNLGRNNRYPDEFDTLVTTVNAMVSELTVYQKQNEDRLREKEREIEIQKMNAINSARLASLGEMAGGIAHEINNPLAIIVGSAQRLERELDNSNYSQVRKCSNQIRQTCERIGKVVTSLRKLARDGENSPRTRFSVAKLVQEVLSLCEEKIRQDNITIEVDIQEDKDLTGNEVEVSQVLFNLINNAADAVRDLDKKWIHIVGARRSGTYVISVIDSGKGIPVSIATRIMEPFYTTKEVGKGTGLGLSISLSIAKRHGGDLKLDSNSLHTKFDLYIPEDLALV
ncbi:MAG: GHKL domain-containing protein [Chitinophagaceae bacterium]|nr:GHKL domain-containing protein [Oligoflexus sp.]